MDAARDLLLQTAGEVVTIWYFAVCKKGSQETASGVDIGHGHEGKCLGTKNVLLF